MKTLIENTIEFYGMGHPDVKTVFNIKNDEEMHDLRFTPLSRISGRLLTAWFKYEENGVKIDSKLQMRIPSGLNDDEVRDFVVTNINAHLTQ